MDTINLVYIYFYVSLDTRSDKLALVINNFKKFFTLFLDYYFISGFPSSSATTPCSSQPPTTEAHTPLSPCSATSSQPSLPGE